MTTRIENLGWYIENPVWGGLPREPHPMTGEPFVGGKIKCRAVCSYLFSTRFEGEFWTASQAMAKALFDNGEWHITACTQVKDKLGGT